MGEPARVLDVETGEDVSSLLSTMSTPKKATTRKSKVPVIEGHEDAADHAVAARRAFKQAETEWRMAEAQVLEKAGAIYVVRAKAGNFSKSLNLSGRETAGVQVKFSDRFTALPSKESLLEGLGQERYGQLFTEERKLALKPERTDDASIRFLLERLGPTFRDYFDVEIEVKPKSGFDQRQFELPDNLRQAVRQFKPSVVAL